MSANSTLEHILREILEVLKPKQEDLATRAQVISELQRVVESVQSLRGAAVEPFGSFVSNLFTKWGDVDISINLPKEGGYISYVESDRKQRLLVDLLNPLRGQWQMVQFIPAKVPILKCKSSHKIFSCDISIDNLKGQMKSKLLLWISEIDGRFRDMILLVKEWAKAHDINDPNSGTLNSYSLSLLVIFHFQTCEPAIFPPLEDIYTGNVADDLQGLRTVAERNIAEACAANIRRFRQNKVRGFNHSSLSELFISFLAKFSNIGVKASEQGICTKTGEWVYRRSNIRWSRKTDPILIEDPFEQPENSARAVKINGLTRISEAFKISRRSLSSADQNQDSLLVTLVRSQVSQEIRARLRNPVSYGGGYQPHLTHPHVHRNVNLQAETQNQFQNSRLESCSYNPSMTEIVQAQSQGQHSGDAGKSSLSIGGLLLGGLVAGLGYMYAPEISKAADGLKKFLDKSDDDSDFSDKEFEASKLGICTYTGKFESRRRNIRWSDNNDAILIEDPFEQTENSARAVSMSGLTRISETFEMSRVISADQNLDSLLATLVRPQVSLEINARHNQGQHSGDTGTSSALVSGLLLGGLGGLVAGTLGYMFAPEISKAADGLKKFLDKSDDDSDEPKN